MMFARVTERDTYRKYIQQTQDNDLFPESPRYGITDKQAEFTIHSIFSIDYKNKTKLITNQQRKKWKTTRNCTRDETRAKPKQI